MSKRSKARQVTVQMLFQNDFNTDVDAKIIKEMIADRLEDRKIREFAWELYQGVMQHRDSLDEKIQAIAANWSVNRMAGTDRAIIRLGAYELNHTDTPVGVAIDEALELAKKFGSSHSSQFVNGILDRIVPTERRDPRRPVPTGTIRSMPENADPTEIPEGAVSEAQLKKMDAELAENGED